MIKNLKLILDKNDLRKIVLIFFLNCIVAILELCSIRINSFISKFGCKF